MAYLTKQQVKEIIEKAPTNLDKGKLIESLAKIHTIEGYNDTKRAPKSLGGFASNVVSSGADLVKNTAQAIMNPVETVKSIGSIAVGASQKLIPGKQSQEANFDGLIDFYKQRYGSLDKLKETAYNDPVGVASDVATVAGGVGLAAKVGTVSKVGNFSKVAKVANTVNKFTDPLQAITVVPGAILPKSFLSKTAQRVYQSALKPSTTLSPAERSRVLLTGLREGIPVNTAGARKLGLELDDLNKQIANVIEEGRKAGDVVQTSQIVKYLDDVKERVGKTINGSARLEDITSIEKNFLKQYGDTIPTNIAQEIKKNTYKVLRNSYGEMKSAAIEGEKAMARGIKDQLVKKYKQLETLNARDSALIDLDRAIEKAVARIDNRDVVGLGATVAGTANPIAGVLKALIDNPTIKSKLAIALQKTADRIPKNSKFRKYLTPAQVLSKPEREAKQ